MIRAIICWFFHRGSHVPIRREGDYSTVCCVKCEHEWIMPRLDEHDRLGRQCVVDASHSGNPYCFDDFHATRDGYDPGEPDGDGGFDGGSPLGRGDTRWAAIRDLLEQEAA